MIENNQQAVEESIETKKQKEANQAFNRMQIAKRHLHDQQEILKAEIEKDNDYANYTSDMKEMNANRKELKKKLINDHPDIKKKFANMQDAKQAVSDCKEVMKGYGLEALAKGEQLSLFDNYEARNYKFNFDPRFIKVKKEKKGKRNGKPVIENMVDQIARDQKHEAEGAKKMEAK